MVGSITPLVQSVNLLHGFTLASPGPEDPHSLPSSRSFPCSLNGPDLVFSEMVFPSQLSEILS